MTANERLEAYQSLLLAWSEKLNLIGPEVRRNPGAHIGEAVAAAEILKPRGAVLDFGSGAGLPAIPMAICLPQAQFHLVEADQKKWSFLKRAVRTCELNSLVHGDRLSAVLPGLPPDLQFALVTSRAVGNPEGWVPLLVSRMEARGRFALFQSSPEIPQGLGAEDIEVNRLPRGQSNYLVTFTVPRGTS